MFEELSLHVLDIGMNSLAAGARTVAIVVHEDVSQDKLLLQIQDDGCGMDEAALHKVITRCISSKIARQKPVGLGLALLRQTSEMCGGQFRVESRPGHGTTVTATMQMSHIDRPPVGDLSSSILSLCAAAPHVDVRLSYRVNGDNFEFSSQELHQQEGANHEPRRTQETQRESATTSRAA